MLFRSGRVKTYEAIIKGDNISDPGIPESFRVMLKELQALALDVTVLDEEGNEVQMGETLDEGASENVSELINDKNFELQEESFEEAGFRETTVDGLDDDSSISAD